MNRRRRTDKHLPPCVYFKHGRYWYVKKGKWNDLGTDLAGALRDYAQRVETPKGGMAALINDAMPSIVRGKAKATVDQYNQAAKILRRKLAEFAPEDVTTKTVYAVQESLARKPNMANRVLTVLRLVFTYAVKHHPRVMMNPCTGVKRLTEGKRERLITGEEWAAIHAKAGPRLRVIMALQLCTGQRIGDVLKLRRSQIGEDGITFKQQKTGAKLLVRWSPELRAAVADAEALHTGPKTLTLLRGRFGGPPDYRSVLLQWHEAREAAGVEDALPNDQRAMSATNTKRQGGDAQALLGHTSPAMTERYLRDRETPEVEGPSIQKVLDATRKR